MLKKLVKLLTKGLFTKEKDWRSEEPNESAHKFSQALNRNLVARQLELKEERSSKTSGRV